MTLNRGFISLLALVGSWCYAGTPANPKPALTYGQLPLVFERNQGQADPSVRFLARGRRYVIGLVDDGLQLRLKEGTVHLQFSGRDREGAFKGAHFDASGKLPGVSNYLIGNDPRLWIEGVPQYGTIWQRGLYPGIDVAYYGTQGQLEYDFVVHAGADPEQFRMHITGAGKLRLDANGDLMLDVNGAELRQKLPVAYQEHEGKRIAVPARYRLLAGDMVGITVADYDRTQPLVIDPVLALAYSTYLGGSMLDQSNGIAVDANGDAWIAGSTTSVDFPVMGAPSPANGGGTDAFIAKIDPTGRTLLFSTYLGGSGTDQANGIAVDPQGNAYVTGSTNSPNFPTKTPLQAANAGGLDAFAVKLTSSGSLVYSTYLGGSRNDSAAGIAVDINGIAYIAGSTSSSNFPTMSPQQSAYHGEQDAFVLKLNAAGSALLYSTYLGGTSSDQANGIAVDSFGSAYIAGATQSGDFPVSVPFQATYGGAGDAFVVKLNSSGFVVYSTFLGGNGVDAANAIAVDSSGDAFIAGSTTSGFQVSRQVGTNFPVSNAFQPRWSDVFTEFGSPDAFLTKLNPTGSALVFSTYFGGATTGIITIFNRFPGGPDIAYGVAVDSAGNAYLTGSTSELGTLTPASPFQFFPLQDPLQGYVGPSSNGSLGSYYHTDAFLASFSPTGSLLYSTDLGGQSDDVATSVAVDASGAAYITGYSKSSDLPLQTPLQSANPAACTNLLVNCGTSDAFISKFTFSTPGVRVFFGASVPGNTTLSANASMTIAGSGCNPGSYSAGNTQNTTLGTPVIFQPGASCSVSVQTSPSVAGTRYVFTGWGDGPTSNPRVIAAPAHSTSYTVDVAPQYLLTTSVSPAGGGSILVSPSSPDGFYASGTGVLLSAVANPGFTFSNFTGDLVGIASSQPLTMAQPHSVTAVFVPNGSQSVNISGSVTVGGSGLNGVAVELSGSQSGVTLTSGPGSFSFTGLLMGGSFTVTPVLAGYTFTPPSQTFASANGNLTANFTATIVQSFTISGQVTVGGVGAAAVTINVNGSETTSTTTNASGNYAFLLPQFGTYTISASLTGESFSGSVSFSNLIANQTANFTGIAVAGLDFYPVNPCRVADTRVAAGFTGNFGPPSMVAGTVRTFNLPASSCGIPATASAYSLNFTVVPPSGGQAANLTTWPTGLATGMPNVSTLNYSSNVVANAAIVPAGTNGSINVAVDFPTDVLFDINGYFAPPLASGLEFFSITPCRVADTRTAAGFTGQFGPPALLAGATRPFTVAASSCGIPATATAYSLNFTVVPPSSDPAANLTVWPATEPSMPNVSTLNYSSSVVANAAIVPTGTNGAIDVFANQPTDMLFDANGYFAPALPSGLHFYPVAPCRVADTRVPAGFGGPFGPPSMSAGVPRTFTIPSGSCGIPATAAAYSLNFTVVPPAGGPPANVTAWPTGLATPNVSTLNYSGSVVANAAIVVAGTNGAINVSVDFMTDLLFDINGYFAP